MNPLETREVAREHVLMFAQVKVGNSCVQQRMRIRNLSAQGIQLDGDAGALPGQSLEVDFGSAGKVRGFVSWCDGTVLGVRLEQRIEPHVVRRSIIENEEVSYRPPWFVRSLVSEKNALGPKLKV